MKEFSNIALLIDAENITHKYLNEVLESLASYGTISVRRIYADWTGNNMGSWKIILQDNALNPIQQFSSVKGKNSTDSAMIIDAMDLLHEGIFDCFAIVSSDSDFTRIAQRIGEKGKYVIGYGEKKTPKSFRMACNDFVVLSSEPQRKEQEKSEKAEIERLIRQGVDQKSGEDGWCNMATVGSYIRNIYPDFDVKILGKNKLINYFKDKDNEYEVRDENPSGPGPVYVRRISL